MSDRVTISYSMDGENWQEVSNQNISEKKDFKANEENVFTFDPITAKYIRWNLYNEAKLAAGVSEVCVYEKMLKMDVGTSVNLKSLKINGADLEGFSADQDFYTLDLDYGEAVPQVSAEAEDENAVVFIVPAISANDTAIVQVISEDGNEQKSYMVQFHEKAPVLAQATIEIAKQPLIEDDVEPIRLTARLQDGDILQNGVLEVTYTVGNPEIAEVRDGQFYALNPGTTTLKAAITYHGITVDSNELTLTIEKNPAQKLITGYEQVSVETGKGVKPVLPEKIRATFNVGLPKEVPVTWDEINPEQYGKYGTFTVKGTVEGQELCPQAKVTVKGITGIEQFSCATPVGVTPKLAERARIYYSDGTIDEAAVTWDEHPQELFLNNASIVTIKGTAKGMKTQTTVRVTMDTENGDKFTGYKNGFYWPLGMASFTNGAGSSGDSASKLNDNIISHNPEDNNRWCNWDSTARSEDWAGIVFGLEEVTYKFIDNLEIDFYTDHGASLPTEYTVEYYDGEYFNVPPSDPNNVTDAHPAGVNENWKPVNNLRLNTPAMLSDSETNYFTFDMVETCAIRIRMKAAANKCLGITEMAAYERLAISKNEPAITGISLNGTALLEFDPKTMHYVYRVNGEEMPQITAQTTQNASVSVIYPEGFGADARLIVRAENGVDTKTYTIRLEKGDSSVDDLEKELEELRKQLVQAKEDLELRNSELKDAQEAVKEATKEKENAQQELRQAEIDLKEANEKLEAAKREAEDAKEDANQKVAEAQNEVQKAQERVTEAQTIALKAEESLAAALNEKASAEKALSDAQEEIAGLQQKVAILSAELSDALKKLEDAREAQKKAEQEAKAAKEKAEQEAKAAKEAQEARLKAEQEAREAQEALKRTQQALEEAQKKLSASSAKKTVIRFDKKKYTVKKGKSVRLGVTIKNQNGAKVTYKSANKKIARVSKKGVVKGLKKGKTKITVTCNKKKKSVTVQVK